MSKNRIAFGKPEQEHKTEKYALICKPPTNYEEMDTILEQFANMIVAPVFAHNLALAPVVLALTAQDGPIVDLAKTMAQSIGKADWETCYLASLCVLGQRFYRLEAAHSKELLNQSGLPKVTQEWLNGHCKSVSMLATTQAFKELKCVCPGCVLFWAAKHQKTNPNDICKFISEAITAQGDELQWYGEGCVSHIIASLDGQDWVLELTGLNNE